MHKFLRIYGCMASIFSKNNRVPPCMDRHQPGKFRKSRFGIAICVEDITYNTF